MKKGFTLMEVLAVLMLVALVTSFAVPMYRVARQDMRYNQAQGAAKKLAEAMRMYYTRTQGYTITDTDPVNSSFDGINGTGVMFSKNCDATATSGIPSHATKAAKNVDNLFGCGYLVGKDFAGLPFEFAICNPRGESANCGGKSNLYVRVKGLADSGKYNGKYFHIDSRMVVSEE